MFCGFLNLNKPQGWTSRDAVNVVQKLVRPTKAGHAGTLDPLATGVLVVAVGRATRLIEYAQRGAKRYLAEFLLGRASDTEDIEGEVVVLDDPPRPTRREIEAAIPNFLGEIPQRPPAYSAIKVKGKRAYKLARSGEAVTLPARNVRIDEIRIADYDYPKLQLEVACGSGTYIRSLGRDLAVSLGTGAVMSSLVRTAVGPFALEDAISADELSEAMIGDSLMPPECTIADLPRQTFNASEIQRLVNGQVLATSLQQDSECEFAAFDQNGTLLGVACSQQGRWKIVRNIAFTS